MVARSTEVAVWLDLWGSMPMTIMEDGSLLCQDGIRGGQSDFKYLSQQLGVTPLFSHSANADRKVRHTPKKSTRRTGDRMLRSQPFRSATERYGQLTRPRTDDTNISRNLKGHGDLKHVAAL